MGVVMHEWITINLVLKKFKACPQVNQTLTQSISFTPCTEGTESQSLQVLKIPLAVAVTGCPLQRVLYSRGLKLVLLGLMPEWPQGSNKRHHDGRLLPNSSSPREGAVHCIVIWLNRLTWEYLCIWQILVIMQSCRLILVAISIDYKESPTWLD